MRLSALFILILPLIILTSTVNAQEKSGKITEDRVMRSRLLFLERYTDRDRLFSALNEQKWRHILENPGAEAMRIDDPEIFWSTERLDAALGTAKAASGYEYALRVHNFVRDHMRKVVPLFEDTALHEPIHFFTAFGGGFCDDAAANLVALAERGGVKGRTWWLTGHVVAELNYGGGWHVFDPHTLGVVYDDEEVASLETLVDMAKAGKLSQFNSEFSTTGDNKVRRDDIFPKLLKGDPYLELLPGEKRYFFSTPYMLSTSGRYLKKTLPTKDKFNAEYSFMGNMVRRIPLDSLGRQGTIIVDDYFPIAGAFLNVLNEPQPSTEDIQALFDTSILHGERWVKGIKHTFAGKNYIDFSHALRHLEWSPGYGLTLRINAERTRATGELLLVHYFAFVQANFGSFSQSTSG